MLIKNNEYALYSDPKYSATFGGGHDLHISNNANITENSLEANSYLAGDRNFSVLEIETYAILT
jgi:hypothetical protein